MRKVWMILLLLIALTGLAALYFHLHPNRSLLLCSEQTIIEKLSPDGRYVAVLMHRNCWRSGHNAHINLRLASSPPFRTGRLGGPINDGEIFGTFGVDPPDPHFCWSGPKRLEIAGLEQHRIPEHAYVVVPDEPRDVSVGGDYSSCQ
jgi:hypothetical protein